MLAQSQVELDQIRERHRGRRVALRPGPPREQRAVVAGPHHASGRRERRASGGSRGPRRSRSRSPGADAEAGKRPPTLLTRAATEVKAPFRRRPRDLRRPSARGAAAAPPDRTDVRPRHRRPPDNARRPRRRRAPSAGSGPRRAREHLARAPVWHAARRRRTRTAPRRDPRDRRRGRSRCSRRASSTSRRASRSHYAALGRRPARQARHARGRARQHLRPQRHDLAFSVTARPIWADPHVIKHPVEYAAQLAPIVGVDEIELAAGCRRTNTTFVYVARKVEPDVATAVRKLGPHRRRASSRVEALLPVGRPRGPGARLRRHRQRRPRRARVGARRDARGQAGKRHGRARPAGQRAPRDRAHGHADPARRRPRAHARPVDPVRDRARADRAGRTRSTPRAAWRSSSTCAPATSSRWRPSTARPRTVPRSRRRRREHNRP